MGDGFLIVFFGRGIVYFNGSMWVEDNYMFYSGDYRFIFSFLYFIKKYFLRLMNVLIYFYENNIFREFLLIYVFEEGVMVIFVFVKYWDVYCCFCLVVYENWIVEFFEFFIIFIFREMNYIDYFSFMIKKIESSSLLMFKNEGICGVGVLVLLLLLLLSLVVKIWNLKI